MVKFNAHISLAKLYFLVCASVHNFYSDAGEDNGILKGHKGLYNAGIFHDEKTEMVEKVQLTSDTSSVNQPVKKKSNKEAKRKFSNSV